MGKAKLSKNFERYTGLVPPNGNRFYATNRYGETVISHYPKHRDPDTLTANQKASNGEFAQARLIADTELADPIKHDEWLHKWHEENAILGWKYKTLRGYTIAQIRKQLNSSKFEKSGRIKI